MAAELNICSPITNELMAKVVRTNGQECLIDKNNQVSTASGAVGVTLPTVYDDDTCVVVEDSSGNAATNNITVTAGGGQTIDGDASVVIDENRGALAFVRDTARNRWTMAIPPRQLDGATGRVYTAADILLW